MYHDMYHAVTSVSQYVSYLDLCITICIVSLPLYRGMYHIVTYVYYHDLCVVICIVYLYCDMYRVVTSES